MSNSRFTALARACPYLALLTSILALNTGTSLAKQLFPQVGAVGTTAYRVGFSALILTLIWRPWRQRWGQADLLTILPYGAALGLMNLCFYLALRTLPLGISLAIVLMGPLSLALFHSRKLAQFMWVGLAVTGLALLLPLRHNASIDATGVVFAFAASLCWTLYIIFGQRAAHLHSGRSVALGMTIAAILIVPMGAATVGGALFAPGVATLGLLAAVLSSALPFSLEMIALKHIPKRTFGVLVSAEPAVGALTGVVLLGETLTGLQWLAIGMIVAAGVGSVTASDTLAPQGQGAEQTPLV